MGHSLQTLQINRHTALSLRNREFFLNAHIMSEHPITLIRTGVMLKIE